MVIQLEMSAGEKRILVQELRGARNKIEMAVDHCKSLKTKDEKHIECLEKRLEVLNGVIFQLNNSKDK